MAVQRLRRGAVLSHFRAAAANSNLTISPISRPKLNMKEQENTIRKSVTQIIEAISRCLEGEVKELVVVLQLDCAHRIWVVEFERCVYRPEVRRPHAERKDRSVSYANTCSGTGGPREQHESVSYVDLPSEVQNVEIRQLVLKDADSARATVRQEDSSAALSSVHLLYSKRDTRSGTRSVPEIDSATCAVSGEPYKDHHIQDAKNNCSDRKNRPAVIRNLRTKTVRKGETSPYLQDYSAGPRQLVVKIPQVPSIAEEEKIAPRGLRGIELSAKSRHATTQSVDLPKTATALPLGNSIYSSARRIRDGNTEVVKLPQMARSFDVSRRTTRSLSAERGEKAKGIGPYESREGLTRRNTRTSCSWIAKARVSLCAEGIAEQRAKCIVLKYPMKKPHASSYVMFRRTAALLKRIAQRKAASGIREVDTATAAPNEFLVAGKSSLYARRGPMEEQ